MAAWLVALPFKAPNAVSVPMPPRTRKKSRRFKIIFGLFMIFPHTEAIRGPRDIFTLLWYNIRSFLMATSR
jgi:hypothetical protein